MEFVINLTTKDMAFPTDWCGVRSGRNYRKFEEMKLTPGRCTVVSAPLIEDLPLHRMSREGNCFARFA